MVVVMDLAEPGGDGVSEFPFRTITIEAQKSSLFQADCERCGWHTRQADSEAWVKDMARVHFPVCPNPYFRSGAIMECGCWYYARPGDSASTLNRGPTKATCPLHGETVIVKANVDEPTPYGKGDWTPAVTESAVHDANDADQPRALRPKSS